MDFARQQRDPSKHVIGIAFVVLVHALVIWALMSGLARTAVEVIKKPLTATIVEQINPPPPPPPPPKKIVEPPKVKRPPEVYVPPPDIPPPVAPAQSPIQSTPTPPPEPYVVPAPTPPVVAPPAPPAPPPKPAIRRNIVPLSKVDPEYPRAAIRAGIEKGKVVARVNIDDKGNVTDVTIVSADPPRVFERAVQDALMQWKFKGEGEKYVGEVEITFTLKD